jgi:chromosome segregation ATPase
MNRKHQDLQEQVDQIQKFKENLKSEFTSLETQLHDTEIKCNQLQHKLEEKETTLNQLTIEMNILKSVTLKIGKSCYSILQKTV